MAMHKGETNQFPPRAHGVEDITITLDRPPAVITVADTGVTLDSAIVASVRLGTDRESDEMEMDPVQVCVGTIVVGTSFDLVVVPMHPDSSPEGAYRVLYERW